ECQNSGMTVKEWCRKKGIRPNTYYRHQRMVREEQNSNVSGSEQQIIPVSVSSELCVTGTPDHDIDRGSNISSCIIRDDMRNIMIRKADIEIELPQETSEKIVIALLRGLREC
ncbi:MAG: IS66 family insertion sequence element accessory protein TnpB, partial [Ruminococcus sp.]|nr:IS66 family insertion sequence element accessory protein TnpB [Ruminococcus sp.]